MTVLVFSRGDLEGVPIYQDFDAMCQALARAAGEGYSFFVIEKTDTKRVLFATDNINRVEEVD